MADDNSARNALVVSDERIRNKLRQEIDRAINLDRSTTRAQIAQDSGVNIHTIDSITTRDVAKHRRICASEALSIAWVLGERCVSALISTIGYVARPLDDADELQPMAIAAGALAQLSIIATAAADGRIDHTEAPSCRDAADAIIATVLPLSSAGGAG